MSQNFDSSACCLCDLFCLLSLQHYVLSLFPLASSTSRDHIYIARLLGLLWCLQCGRPGFDPWIRKIHWKRKWQPTPVLLPGKSHDQRSMVGYSPWGCKESDTTESLHFRIMNVSVQNVQLNMEVVQQVAIIIVKITITHYHSELCLSQAIKIHFFCPRLILNDISFFSDIYNQYVTNTCCLLILVSPYL